MWRRLFRTLSVSALGLALLGSVASAQPTNAGISQLSEQANEAFSAGRFDDAASMYRRILTLDRSQTEAYVRLSAIAFARKNYADALKRANEGLEIASSDSALLGKKSIALIALGQTAEGVEFGQRALAKSNCLFDVQLAIANLFEKEQNFSRQKEAAALFERFLVCRPSEVAKLDDAIRLRLALAAIKGGDYAAAERALTVVLKAHPNEVVPQQLAAATALGQGNYKRALDLYAKLTREGHVQRGQDYNVALAQFRLGRLVEAATTIERFLAKSPGEKGYLLQGDIFVAQRNTAQALISYSAAERAAPASAAPALKMAALFVEQKKPAQAKPILERILVTQPYHAEALEQLVGALIALDDPQAVAVAKRSVAADPKSVPAHVLLGRAYLQRSQVDDAEVAFRAAVALDPKSAIARQGLLGLLNRRAKEAFVAKRYGDAEKSLNEALTLDESSQLTKRNIALTRLASGRAGLAGSDLEKLEQKSAGDAVIGLLRARALAAQGKHSEAVEIYRLALSIATSKQQEWLIAEIEGELGRIGLVSTTPDFPSAVSSLERAVAITEKRGGEALSAHRRNLALALFGRGVDRLRTKQEGAVSDLRRALSDPSVLTENEPTAVRVALALALMAGGSEAGAAEATALLGKLDPNQIARVLRPPYDKVGGGFFGAYAGYLQDSTAKRTQAIETFTRLLRTQQTGELATKLRELIASAHSLIAFDAATRDSERAARQAISAARKLATTAAERAILDVNEATLDMASSPEKARKVFESHRQSVPEALVNLGLILDSEGDSKGALQAWQEAQKRGVNSSRLREWIEIRRRWLEAP